MIDLLHITTNGGKDGGVIGRLNPAFFREEPETPPTTGAVIPLCCTFSALEVLHNCSQRAFLHCSSQVKQTQRVLLLKRGGGALTLLRSSLLL